MHQVERLSTLLTSQVLAVPKILLIFRLHFVVISLYLFFHLNSPSVSLIFTLLYSYAADLCFLNLLSSVVGKASSLLI